ncbi:MAG: nuclease [Alphaproteobacteria bacterium]|nr:nuclease [Alphaproteobacteria bacterium]
MHRQIFVLALLGSLAGLPLPGWAGEDRTIDGPVEATVIAVIDGDTLVVEARIWPDHTVRAAVRLDGIDAPELRGACVGERLLAWRAKDALAAIAGVNVRLVAVRHDKYGGRVVARVQDSAGRDLGARLVASGLARAYDGGQRQPWCD